MGRARKILLVLAGLVVLFVVAAAVFVKVYFTKERIMALVIPPLETRLHRQVTLKDAGAGLTGFYLDGLAIQGEKEASPLLRVDSVRLGWDLLALFRGKVALDEVALASPRIALVRDKTGRLSIEDLMAPKEVEKKEGAPKEAPKPSGGMPFSVSINTVALEEGEVSFTDEAAKPAKTYRLSEIDFRAKDFSLTGPFGYWFSAAATVGKPFNISAEGTVDLKKRNVDSHIEVARVLVAPALEEIAGSPPAVRSGELTLACDMKLTGFKDVSLKVDAKAKDIKLASANGPAGPLNLSLNLDTALGLPVKEVAIKGLGLELNGQRINGSGSFVKGNSPHQVKLNLTSKSLDIDEILRLFPEKEKPEEGKEAGPASAEETSKKPVVIKPPPARGKVSLKIERLKVKNVVVSPLEALAQVKDRGVYIEPMKGELYSGAFAGKADALFGTAGPRFSKEMRVAGVSLDPLITALKPKMKGQLHGTLNLDMDATGEGGDLKKLRSNLELTVTQGKLKNHPAVERIARLFKAEELEVILFDELKAEASTAFGVATIKRLTLTGPHIRLSGYAAAGLIDKKLKGKLTVKVPRKWAKNIINVDAVLDEISDKQGWPEVPVIISGTTEDPKFNVDPEWLAKKTVGAVGRGVKKVIEDGGTGAKDLGKGIEKGLKKGIKDLKESLPFLR